MLGEKDQHPARDDADHAPNSHPSDVSHGFLEFNQIISSFFHVIDEKFDLERKLIEFWADWVCH